MVNHIKPTKEELQAQADAALAEAERLEAEEKAKAANGNPPQETPEEQAAREAQEAEAARLAEEERIKAEQEGESGETPEEQAAREAQEQADADKAKQGTDWKKRYTDSSREAKILASKNKELNDVIDDASQLTEPTEDEMKSEYPEWEEMTTTEQRLAKGDLLNKKRFELIHGATQKYKKVEDWNIKVDTYIEDPRTLIANPELEGKQSEFKIFASGQTRVGMDFDDLVLAFIGDEAKKVRPNHQGHKMFEAGTGGSKKAPPPPDDKLSVEQSIIDRKTNFTLYKQRLQAGKYKTE